MIAVCCSVLADVIAVCYSVFADVIAECCNVLQCVAVCWPM